MKRNRGKNEKVVVPPTAIFFLGELVKVSHVQIFLVVSLALCASSVVLGVAV